MFLLKAFAGFTEKLEIAILGWMTIRSQITLNRVFHQLKLVYSGVGELENPTPADDDTPQGAMSPGSSDSVQEMGYGESKEQLKFKPAVKTCTGHANVEKLKRRKTLDETTMSKHRRRHAPRKQKKHTKRNRGHFLIRQGGENKPQNFENDTSDY
ncbi:hypothetical protein RUM43_009162 [Polyplax serrata]|uniref:Uncharacterized protein n=1 Tax=Polyplax serrata TaxID=468196 RepID=A0AAN8NUX1_POLSC